MNTDSPQTLTRLLAAWGNGDPEASEELLPLVYDQLRSLAREYLRRERADHTLQPTALVHEAYLRLAGGASIAWQGRAQFYSVAARAMRRVLVDHARAREVRRRGAFQHRVPLTNAQDIPDPESAAGPDILALDAALARLAEVQPRRGQVVEMRFFGGMDVPEIAAVLNVSEKTVLRDWQVAKIWLHRAIGESPG